VSIVQRIDAITGITEQYRAAILPAPRSLKMELNTACNFKCSFCVRSVRVNDRKEMSRTTYSRLIREFRAAGIEELGLFYINEPFTVPWLAEAIQEAKDIGFPYIFLTSNGAAATEEKLDAVMKAGLDSLKFSLNFSDAEQLQEITGTTGRNFAKTLAAIRAARRLRDKNGYQTKIYASSIAFDGEQGARMQKVIDEVKPLLDEHYFLPLYGMNGASKSHGWKPQPGNPGRLDNMREPLPCWSVFQEAHVSIGADGNPKLSACCFGNGIDGDMVMADLNEVSFMDGWNSDKYQALRAAHLRRDVSGTPCAECAAA
jgi:hypothetical protein